METKEVVNYYKSNVEPFVLNNKVTLSVIGGALVVGGLVAFFMSNRGKRFAEDVASTATDLVEEVQNQMISEKPSKIVKERRKAKQMA